jgi:hypothetical protein
MVKEELTSYKKKSQNKNNEEWEYVKTTAETSTVISLCNGYAGKRLYFTLNEHYEIYTTKPFILV